MRHIFKTSCLPLIAAVWGLGAASPSWARLEPIGSFEHGAVYVDASASIERDGDHRKLWTVTDYKQRQALAAGGYYLSTRSWLDLDCRARQARVLHITFFEGAGQSGRVLQREGVLHDWLPIPADSPMHRLQYKYC